MDSSASSRRRGFGIGGGLFALCLLGAGAALFVTLVDASRAGQAGLDAYVASVAGGAEVSEEVGGAEASALTELLRETRSVSIDNFQAQAGTACFWVELHHAGRSTDARFVLAERGEEQVVIRASLRRECVCPDPDFEERCHLE